MDTLQTVLLGTPSHTGHHSALVFRAAKGESVRFEGSLIMPEKELWEGSAPRKKGLFSFSSTDPDEVAEYMTNNFGKVAIQSRELDRPIGIAIEFGAMPGLVLDHTSLDGSFDLVPQAEIKGLFFRFPIAGSIAIRSGSRLIEASETHATCAVSEELDRLSFISGSRHSQIGVVRSMCQDRLAQMFDCPIIRPIVFEPKVALSDGDMQKLASLVHFLAQTDFADLNMLMPAKATYLPHMIVDSLLTCWPHNYSHLFQVQSSPPTRRSTEVALSYLDSHLLELPSPEDLAFVAGVSLRSLQYAFKTDFGLGIAEYQRRLRIAKARAEILHSDGRIEDIAKRWGFTNWGRFSREFQAVFGQTPTQCRKQRHVTGWTLHNGT